jgi:NAD(P)-dependent dehydrogenase (short-subunit alcohol dehydrogenase family)
MSVRERSGEEALSKEFAGKSVIVTGAASGIGKAAAYRFADEGAKVCVADLNLAGAETVAAALKEKGAEAFATKVDVSALEDNDRMVAETVAAFGGLDVAFLNAGYYGPGTSIFDDDISAFDRIIAINLRGCFLGIRAVAKSIRSGGAIVVTGSTGGILGLAVNPAYSASKHGLIGLVRSAAEPLAERGVRINAILPGGVNTPLNFGEMVDTYYPPDELKMPAFRGYGESQHIAEFALFLASPRAAFINGGAHVADGGLTSSFAAVRYDKPD